MRPISALSALTVALALVACDPSSTQPRETGPEVRVLRSETVDPYTVPGKASVSPRYGNATAVAGSSGNVVTFEVTNTGYGPGEYSISCLVGGVITSCAVASSLVTIEGAATKPVAVTYSAGAEGAGTVTLLAASSLGTDMGHYYVTVQAGATEPPPAAPSMRVSALSLQLGLKKKGAGIYDVTATATATVVDAGGARVAGAVVAGDFSRTATVFRAGATAKTGSSGVATVRSSTVRAASGDVIEFCVTGVTHASLQYDASASAVTCARAAVP